MPVLMSGEEFVLGYEQRYGVKVAPSDRAELVDLLDKGDAADILAFNFALGAAWAFFPHAVRASVMVDGSVKARTPRRFAILLNATRQDIETFRLKLVNDWSSPAFKRLVIIKDDEPVPPLLGKVN